MPDVNALHFVLLNVKTLFKCCRTFFILHTCSLVPFLIGDKINHWLCINVCVEDGCHIYTMYILHLLGAM